jgi:hypothetical protein
MFTKIRLMNAWSLLGAASVAALACAWSSGVLAQSRPSPWPGKTAAIPVSTPGLDIGQPAAGEAINSGLAAAPTRSRLPAGVPADFAITPFGYYHPSCVNHLSKGDVLRQNEQAIQRANGTHENIRACAYPHYRADGEKVIGDERDVQQPNISHSWIVSASITTSSAYGSVYAEWLVPPAPSKNDGQTLFFFNGLMDIHDQATIIQPVLGWNADYASGWGIAAWNCCLKGTVWEGTPARVNSGDHLIGSVAASHSCNGSPTCSTWYINIFDEQNQKSSELTTSNDGQTFNWAFGGVLEVYNVVQCADYPYTDGISFFNQYVSNDQFVPISPAWNKTNWSSGLTPQCNYGASFPQQVHLTY